jgi:predicted dehydrogenase
MVSIGVVGAGYWGPNLIRNFTALAESRVKLVCDRDAARRDYIDGLYPGTETTAEFEGLIADPEIDAVVVATPVATHYPLAAAALEAGKHVFIEKPLARTPAECRSLIETADAGGRVLMVGHTFIFNHQVRIIRALIESGDIGDVMYINARRLNLGLFQRDINVAWDLAPHDLSMILYWLDDDPVAINCQGKAHLNPNVEDVTTITLTFANGCVAFIQSSWIDPRKTREITIVGTKKMVVFDDTQPLEKIRIYDKRVELPPHYDTFAEFHYSYHYGDVLIPYSRQSEPLRAECEHFLDCIAGGTESITSGREGLRVVRLLDAASRSLKRSGASVDLGIQSVKAASGK